MGKLCLKSGIPCFIRTWSQCEGRKATQMEHDRLARREAGQLAFCLSCRTNASSVSRRGEQAPRFSSDHGSSRSGSVRMYPATTYISMLPWTWTLTAELRDTYAWCGALGDETRLVIADARLTCLCWSGGIQDLALLLFAMLQECRTCSSRESFAHACGDWSVAAWDRARRDAWKL